MPRARPMRDARQRPRSRRQSNDDADARRTMRAVERMLRDQEDGEDDTSDFAFVVADDGDER